MLPRSFKNFNAYVNGAGWAGRIAEAELPDLKAKLEEFRGGGMDAPKKIDVGMEALSGKLIFAEYLPEIMSLAFLGDTEATRVVLKGAQQRNAEPAQSIIIEIGGSFDAVTMGKWKAGDLTTNEVEVSIGYYKLSIGGRRVWEIDIDNYVRFVGDVDVLGSVRDIIMG
jgi:P2 family phage contractile tail tube protein